ncbi:hypothetical protein GE061_013615 [Apolygus lucorum]|uniref:Uncharacterized protein n=1 Tax=Apolygus lucorum TaxID=248454 RepID=A0A8S9XPI9_APOLU|nr:hypothetical protein GE061_013615 [Apolygus lucorum]
MAASPHQISYFEILIFSLEKVKVKADYLELGQPRTPQEDSKVNWGLLDLDRDREADIADLFHARRGGPVVVVAPVGLGDIGAAQALPAIDHRMIFGTLVPRPFLLVGEKRNLEDLLSFREVDTRKLEVQVSGGPSISQSRDPIIEGTLSDVIQAEVTGDDVINLRFGPILDLLGKDPEAGNPNRDFVLHDQVVPRWRHTILNGSPREEVQGLSSKHSPPSNLLELIPPPINPEVKVNLPKQILIKDNAQTDLQALIATSLSALGANFNILLDPLTDIPNETRKFLLANSVDSAKLSTHLFHKISINRRNAIFPLLHKNVREQCDKTPPNNFLFGSDLSEKIKSAKMLEAAGKDLRPPQTSNFPKPKVSSYRISDKKKGGDKIDGGRSTTQNQGNSSRPSRQPRQSATHKGRRSSNSRKNWSTHQKKYYH